MSTIVENVGSALVAMARVLPHLGDNEGHRISRPRVEVLMQPRHVRQGVRIYCVRLVADEYTATTVGRGVASAFYNLHAVLKRDGWPAALLAGEEE